MCVLTDNSERAGLVHEEIVADSKDMRPYADGSCGGCWNKTWSNYTDDEMIECTTLGRERSDNCHFCSKNCATALDINKHKDKLKALIERAEALGSA